VTLAPTTLLLAFATAMGAPLANATDAAGAGVWPGHVCAAPRGHSALSLEAGAAGYDVAGGVAGMEWGLDGTRAMGGVALGLGYRRVSLRGAATSPAVLHASMRAPIGTLGGWTLCGVGHAGGSRYVATAGSGSVMAGGVGLGVARRVTVRGTAVAAHFEGRGLGARGAGTVLDTDMAGTGWSLGFEAGARVPVGRLELRLTGSMDGFAAGLGVTPYPARALRLGLGYRF
jgi:hypothetical protein